jgi:23S rRNA (adenine-N6)-dimethyltransferase
VVAYEVDGELVGALGAAVARHANVRIVAGDFLAAEPPAEPFQVVGNVPFSLTSRIVDWCLRAPSMRSATLITQLEYARKRTGAYGRWSLLTILTWPDVSWTLRGTIPRTRFRPVPRVDAGGLHVARRHEPLLPPGRRAAYARLVELGFGGRGGSVRASLGLRYPAASVARACDAAGVGRSTVVAFVSPEQWLRLFAALEPAQPSDHRSPGVL